MTSWVDCTNSLGQNVKTTADIINYRCKSVWEGKGVIPEVFYIKDCVIEKTGLPPKNVSAEVLGAYKECESGSSNSAQQRVKTAPLQQQQQQFSSVEYNTPQSRGQAVGGRMPPLQIQTPVAPQLQIPATPPAQVPVMIRVPDQQVFQSPAPQAVMSRPQQTQQFTQAPQSQVQGRPMQMRQQQVPVGLNQQYQPQIQISPIQQVPTAPYQQFGPQMQPKPVKSAPAVLNQQYQQQAPRPQYQPQMQPRPQYQPQMQPKPQYQPQVQPRPVQQVPLMVNQQAPQPQYQSQRQMSSQQQTMSQQNISPSQVFGAAGRIRSSSFPPYSQQYFAIYPQAPVFNQPQAIQPIPSQKTASGQYLAQQQIDAAGSNTYTNVVPRGPFMYNFQITHPQKSML